MLILTLKMGITGNGNGHFVDKNKGFTVRPDDKTFTYVLCTEKLRRQPRTSEPPRMTASSEGRWGQASGSPLNSLCMSLALRIMSTARHTSRSVRRRYSSRPAS